MFNSAATAIYRYWLKLPHRWRRRLIAAAAMWIVFRLIAWTWGQEQLMLWLAAGLVLAFILAEAGLRRAEGVESWLYQKVTGYFQGIVTGAAIPFVIEAWGRYAGSRVRDDLIVATIVSVLFAYLVLVLRRTFATARKSRLSAREKKRSTGVGAADAERSLLPGQAEGAE